MINENNYRGLKESEKKFIKPFNIDLLSENVTKSDSLFLYEINSKYISECTLKSKYIWVHLWRPFCNTEYCQNINYFSNLAENYKGDGLELLMISESYDFKSIQNCIQNSNFNKTIFVLEDSYYGHKLRSNRLMLFNDFNKDNSIETKIGYSDYLFKDSTIIFIGNKLNSHLLDSLIHNNNNR